MNKLDFNILSGWPASTETWEYLQNMILNAQNAGLLGGKNHIVSGCIEAAGNVGNGIIFVNGEMLPFEGGPIQPAIIVVDTPVNRAFFGGASNPYYHNRKAVFGTSPDQVLYADFKRNDPDNGVLARLDKVERMLKPLLSYDVAGTTTYGSWLFWGRPAAEIPAGWEAVPDADWKGRVPVVYDPAQPEFNTIGQVSGEKAHTLSVNEMPAHNHTLATNFSPPALFDTTDPVRSSGVGAPNTQGGLGAGKSIGQTGGGTAHNNLQPYKVVLFIRFVG